MNELGFLLTSVDNAEKVQFNLKRYSLLTATDGWNFMFARTKMDESVWDFLCTTS